MAHTAITIDIYYDDLLLSAIDHKSVVVGILVVAAHDLLGIVRNEWNCDIAIEKAAILASDDQIAADARRAIGREEGKAARVAANLGVDYAAGRKRSFVKRHGTKHKERTAKSKRRTARAKTLRKRVKARARCLFTCGVLPSKLYGSAVMGPR